MKTEMEMNRPLLGGAATWWPVLFAAALMAGFALLGRSHPLGDFANYYFASGFLLKGNFGEWIYDPYSFNTAILSQGYEGLFLNYTPVPPITALFYAPLTVFSPGIARLLFNAGGIVLFLFSCTRLMAHLGIDRRWLCVVPVAFFLPIKSNIDQGQAYFLVFFLLAEGFLSYRHQRFWLSALLWSLAAVLKIFPAIVLLFLLAEKDYKQAGRTVLIAMLLFLASLPWIPWDIWRDYLFDILPRLMNGEINDPFSIIYQSTSVLWRKLLVEDAALNPTPALALPHVFYFIDAAFKLGLLYLGWKTARHTGQPFMCFAVFLFLSLLISGYGSTYGLLLALPLCMALWGEGTRWAQVTALLLALAVNIPVGLLLHWPLLAQFPRLYLLLVVFAALWARARFVAHVPSLLAVILSAAAIGYLKIPRDEPSCIVPLPGGALLAYGFNPDRNNIEVFTYGQRGPSIVRVEMPAAEARSQEGVELQDNQLFYNGVQLTFGNDRKKQPVLLKSGEILYLSDRGRGVGFYGLRIVSQ